MLNNITTKVSSITLDGKPLPAVTTWHRFAEACILHNVWANPELVFDDLYHDEAAKLAQAEGFDLWTTTIKEGLHGRESVRKFARRPLEFWVEFSIKLGCQYR